MFLLLLLGFTAAPAPSAPVVHLARTPAIQWQLSARGDWRAFTRAWGGSWYVRWDERNATPRFVGVPGVDADFADALVDELALLSQVEPESLQLVEERTRDAGQSERRLLRYSRTWKGAPVEGDEVLLVVTGERIGAAWVRLTPLRDLPEPQRGERVLPLPSGEAFLGRIQREPNRVRWVARDGAVRVDYDPRHYGQVNLTVQERTVGDAEITAPARQVQVVDADGTSFTDDDGVHDRTGNIAVTLTGPSLVVTNNRATVTVTGDDPLKLDSGDNLNAAAATLQHHFHVVWDWLAERWPEHAWLDDQVPADVNQASGTCNAYYTGGTITFYPGSDVCNNFGQIADIVYHEVGHGIHDYILAGGSFAGDVSEGSSDYVSATILDDADLAPNAYVDGGSIRELETDKVYPTDVNNEVHNDGLIWGSFLWNLRTQWSAESGDAGIEATDLLFLGALEQGPGLTDLFEAVMVADDDNGDWSDGTPNDCELIALLDQHGIGPGALGWFDLQPGAIEAPASLDTAYPVSVGFTEYGFTCSDVERPTASVWWTDDNTAAMPFSPEAATRWNTQPLTDGGDTWTASLPRVPANSQVRWFVRMTAADGSAIADTHSDTEASLDRFYVGDREVLYCDDLDGSRDGWSADGGLPDAVDDTKVVDFVFDAPGSTAWDPADAVSGTTVLGTVADGKYTASNTSHAMWGELALTDAGLMRLLSYRRMLSVEDGRYDQALIRAGDTTTTMTTIWANGTTSGGTKSHIDEGWTLHDLSLEDVLNADGSRDTPVQVAFTLSSDTGLEYSGWNVDDVCFVQLADAAAHYRRAGLVAEAGEDTVDLSWETPWIRPLLATVLVRKSGGLPSAIDDGVIVSLDLSPTPGEAFALVDDEALSPGETVGYALFAYGRDETDVYVEAVEGENAATATLPEDEPVDTGTPDDTADTGTEEETGGVDDETAAAPDEKEAEEGGCGCGHAPGGLGGLLLIGALALRRRR